MDTEEAVKIAQKTRKENQKFLAEQEQMKEQGALARVETQNKGQLATQGLVNTGQMNVHGLVGAQQTALEKQKSDLAKPLNDAQAQYYKEHGQQAAASGRYHDALTANANFERTYTQGELSRRRAEADAAKVTPGAPAVAVPEQATSVPSAPAAVPPTVIEGKEIDPEFPITAGIRKIPGIISDAWESGWAPNDPRDFNSSVATPTATPANPTTQRFQIPPMGVDIAKATNRQTTDRFTDWGASSPSRLAAPTALPQDTIRRSKKNGFDYFQSGQWPQ